MRTTADGLASAAHPRRWKTSLARYPEATLHRSLLPEIRLIVVDFLQLVHAREKGITEAQELKRVAYGLKSLAKRLKVVVIAPCQVNTKDVEALKDMRPQLKDLQGSSGMRQAADFIGLLYRDGFYNPLSKDPDLLEMRFAACRRTATFDAKLRWNGPTLRIDPIRTYKFSRPAQSSLSLETVQ
jgi:replicative DNA helicase